MTYSDNDSSVVNRNDAVLKIVLELLDKVPDFVPGKTDWLDKLGDVRDAIQGLRPPRIMVMGRSRSGKSSLINAICGLKVSEVSDTEPQTGKAEWKKYYHDGTDLIHILDTRGLQEGKPPKETDTAKTPYESIKNAVKKECPDIIYFVCKATEVYAAVQGDVEICKKILNDIKTIHLKRKVPVIGVLTKCDELSPPQINFPTDNNRKNESLSKTISDFKDYLKFDGELREALKDVIPTVSYAEYEEGDNGLIIPESDMRWNIDKLVEETIKYTPRETHGSLARMAHLENCQLTVARTMVTACTAINTVISGLNPIPGAAIPPVGAIQTFLIMYIAWLSGKEFSRESIQEFLGVAGIGAGANAGMIGLADVALKFIPGVGNFVAAAAGGAATQGIGDSAIAFFLNKS